MTLTEENIVYRKTITIPLIVATDTKALGNLIQTFIVAIVTTTTILSFDFKRLVHNSKMPTMDPNT